MLLLAEHNRAFGYAAAASLALHALVLSLKLPVFREAEPEAAEPPLVARLVEPEPPPPAPAPPVSKPEPPKPVVEAKPAATAKPKRLAKPKAEIQAKPERAPLPSPPVAAEEPLEQEPAPPVPPPVAAPAAPPAPPVVAIAPLAPPAAVDPAAELARYRQQLVALAARHKRYPRIARDNGWTGDVVVRIEIGASGAVSSIKVKTSSGYEVLDAQALEMFGRAAPEVAVPPPLRGKPFTVDVRAVYSLTDRPG
jgi:protein TonB